MLKTRKTTYKNVTVNQHTKRALQWVEKTSGLNIQLSQGSYSTSVAASGSTHAGGGVVDLRTTHLREPEKHLLVKTLRDAGFAAWYRTVIPGLWGEHIHAVLIGDKTLSPAAKLQTLDYDRGLTGLSSHRKDSYTYHPRVKFHFYLRKPVKR